MTAPNRTALIDSVDARDYPVGTVQRGEALATGSNFRTAHVFIWSPRGRLLLQRLAPTRERHPLRWGSSVAGYLHAGETYEEAARRRVREELGLDIPLRLRLKTRLRDGQSLKFVSLFDGRAERAEIAEPAHIAELRYWDTQQLERTMSERPETFTPTFRALYSALRER